MEVWEKVWEDFREVQWDDVNCTRKVMTQHFQILYLQYTLCTLFQKARDVAKRSSNEHFI
jgi:hypothetical protein